jgi:hypothetical protein
MSFSSAVMGRSLGSEQFNLGAAVLHLLLAVVYAVIIASVTRGIRNWRALPAGAAVGLVLYFMNWAFVSFVAPQWTGNELRVAVAHILFGLFAAASYAGFTQKKTVA